jgi:hypothetical protein
MRARLVDVPAGAGAEFGVARGVVGTGDAVDPVPRTLSEAVLAVHAAHGDKAARMLTRFAALPDCTLVWTRLSDDSYRLGCISGPWHYDASAEADEVGVHHVRPAIWRTRRFDGDQVPAAVAYTFARGGRNFQRTHDRAAEQETAALWERNA